MFLRAEPMTKHSKTKYLEMIHAFYYLHSKGFLYHYIHGGNITIRDHKFVKVIDFGKVTLLSLKYRLTKKKQKLYNAKHKQLAYELRNICDSNQSIQTGTYSTGFLLQTYFARIVKHRTFSNVVSRMLFINPEYVSSSQLSCSVVNQSFSFEIFGHLF